MFLQNINVKNKIYYCHVLKEREAATKMFKGKKGALLAQDIGKKTRTFVPGEPAPGEKRGAPAAGASAAKVARPDTQAIKVTISHRHLCIEVMFMCVQIYQFCIVYLFYEGIIFLFLLLHYHLKTHFSVIGCHCQCQDPGGG